MEVGGAFAIAEYREFEYVGIMQSDTLTKSGVFRAKQQCQEKVWLLFQNGEHLASGLSPVSSLPRFVTGTGVSR